ncbi:T9SS type A sorting domain-containing protein [Winogradskyella luteola]|uniref:T9SS type A sorting domain-containing protein n=1 Tax=Winogradskyella luteola TaxID=2828330 RepID=A0A9X1F602_9FLAO|nr:T9SS type A sorting domain-containing protein [Winogradskyella luteola]MBV7267884.1 T9SS type A sorting domain-containing protein [Winogradskyella luteola]
MKKTTLLLIKLIVLITFNTHAQIIYTDITDGIPSGIDFNRDGTNEFNIMANGVYIEYFAYPDNNIHALGTLEDELWFVPDCVAEGFIVDGSNQWEGQGDCSITGFPDPNPTITFNQDEYLAVRFKLGGTDIYYGWIRFSMDNSSNITYKDYAYESTPNTQIATGANALNVNEFELTKKINIYPNPAKNSITINYEFQTNDSKIIIYDLSGRLVNQTMLSNNNNIIDISGLNSGVYIVNLIEDDTKTGFKKLIVE